MSEHLHLDVVVFGPTGFVGRLICEHLARHAPEEVRIGLAGRDTDKVTALAAELPGAAANWPVLRADASDASSLAELAGAAKVVLTTVGPYDRYGIGLVEACAKAGTHYVDLTGEVLFVRSTIDCWHDVAVRSGARIVHSCGFDSVPSDLGVYLTAQQAAADDAGTLTATEGVMCMKGGFSGGTVATMLGQIEATSDRDKARVAFDPYALSPDRDAEPEPRGRFGQVVIEAGPDTWRAPFIMAPYNTQVVRRSNALTDWSYGRAFRYREMSSAGRGIGGLLTAAGMVAMGPALTVGARNPLLRPLLDRVLPYPGEGPSQAARAKGRFRLELTATTTDGSRYRTVVAKDMDPGYDATAIMIGEAAIALALGDDLPGAAGVLTPATGIGDALVQRLLAQDFTLASANLG